MTTEIVDLRYKMVIFQFALLNYQRLDVVPTQKKRFFDVGDIVESLVQPCWRVKQSFLKIPCVWKWSIPQNGKVYTETDDDKPLDFGASSKIL
jgi:hypothetical protein